ncbi:DUF6093 family protein [Nonomuraea sp. NPDC001023]|uniref:DUF6093 family protein n=1 Tax=unclassified Nonomuraea TaxID=2593643 RepID=UPI00332FFC52
MSPLAGSAPIHPRWSEHHRPTATGTQTATCTITRTGAGEGTTDADGTWHPPAAATIYSGSCRVSSRSARSGVIWHVTGDEKIAEYDYIVAVEWDAAEVLEHDMVEFDSAADPLLPGKELVVIGVAYASEQWERILMCRANLTDREA